MDLLRELFGTFSGWLALAVMLFMVVAVPVIVRGLIRSAGHSPAEELYRRAHPEQFPH